MIKRAITLVREINQYIDRRQRIEPSQEIVFRELLLRDLARLGVEDDFDPIGAAANHSLLYLITRAVVRRGARTVLELGAGESTRLLDRLSRIVPGVTVRTIEHDPLWAERVGQSVAHPVLLAPLVPLEVAGKRIEFYEPARVAAAGDRFDLVIVDGPPAYNMTRRYNRAGFLDLVLPRLGPDFMLIIDDAERAGEQFCVEQCRARLTGLGVAFSVQAVRAAKAQYVFSGGGFAVPGLV